MNAIGNEVKRRAALHREGRTSMVREHEDGHVVGRVVAPPSHPAVVGPGAARRREHVAAHDPGAEVVKAARGKVVVDTFSADLVTDQRSSEVAGHLLECLRAEHPLVQRHPPDAHRIVQSLVRTGAVAIDRDSKCVYSKPRHERNSSCAGTACNRCDSRLLVKRRTSRARSTRRRDILSRVGFHTKALVVQWLGGRALRADRDQTTSAGSCAAALSALPLAGGCARERLELRGLLTQTALVLRWQLPVAREKLGFCGGDSVASVLPRSCVRDHDSIGFARDEPEERIAWQLEHVRPGVGALRREALDADLDVASPPHRRNRGPAPLGQGNHHSACRGRSGGTFAQQRAFIDDPTKLKWALCTCRAAKSYSDGLALAKAALDRPDVSCLYIDLRLAGAHAAACANIIAPVS